MGGADEKVIASIEAMGFVRSWAIYALKVNGNDLDASVNFIFENMDSMDILVSHMDDADATNTMEENVMENVAENSSSSSELSLSASENTLSPQSFSLPDPPSKELLHLPTLPLLPSKRPKEEEDGAWKCGACTYMNPPTQESLCIVCEAKRGATFSASQSMAHMQTVELEDEVLSREMNISVEEARSVLKKRESDDRKFAEMMAEPKVECIACIEEFPISECFTVDCDSAHRFCFECMRNVTKIALNENKMAKCMMCSYVLSQREIKQLFGDNSSELSAHLDTEIGSVMASQPDLYIGCPTPDCPEFIIANTPGICERCTCPKCNKTFCSKCKELFHGIPVETNDGGAAEVGKVSGGGLTCGDSAETSKRWNQWRAKDRDEFLQKAKLEGIEQKKKMDSATKDALTRFSELQLDETWKEANCRLCPHCHKSVYRVDGCDTMTCGRDASDKGGGNKQDGCGQKFNWKKAQPYVRDSGDKANLPKSIKDVDPDAAGEVQHHLTLTHQTSDPTISDLTISCDVCLKSIVGPRFSCINCFPGLECCIACSDFHVAGSHDPNTHAFQIFFEDMGAPPSSQQGEASNSSTNRRDQYEPSWYQGIAQFEQARRQARGAEAEERGSTSSCIQS